MARWSLLPLALLVGFPLGACGQGSRDEEARLDFFERKIRPLLAHNCYNCHSADTNSRGGLRVDDRNGLVLGGDRGPAVVPGHPEKSLLIQAVRQTHAVLKMPPKKRLAETDIADLERWIKDGATWPRADLPASVGRYKEKYAKLRKEHWAWQPVRDPKVPTVTDAAWPRDSIDRFVLATLESRKLAPVGAADPVTLIRRLTFDLTGLPPTPEEIDAFLKEWDASPKTGAEAVAKLVDRLLASPQFGERWGRHWLDVARYGESTGSARNLPYPHAWRYRDYVIDAFNSDMPYDRFLREQVAGDLLPAKAPAERDRQLIATGFLALGVRDVNQRFKIRFVMDNIDEQIDTLGRAVLGLTLGCARCHDHKFDPIPATDYYALAGIFQSSDICIGLRSKMGGGGLDYYDTALLLPLSSVKGPDPALDAKLAEAKTALAEARAKLLALAENVDKNPPGPEREKKMAVARKEVKAAQDQMIALSDPALRGPVAYGLRDGKTIGDAEMRIRGEAEKIGPVVPRAFPSVFAVPGAAPINVKQSGRLELANWLASEKNPMTARVMVNRVWSHLFGQGIVTSVDNFGVTGDAPSHPELLDHLATRFVKDGWSAKKLIRAIVLTRTYQLSSAATPAHRAVDPANRLLWRHAPRRLDAEEIRDAMLAAAGRLDLTRPKGSPAMDLKVIELRNDGPDAKRFHAEAAASKLRSVYLPLLRTITPRCLEVFDFAEQGLVTGKRDTTTVPTQALYLLNDPFVRQQAGALAERVLKGDMADASRIQVVYRLTLNRAATDAEIERLTGYLADYEPGPGETNPRAAAWTSLCHAILASAEFRYVR